MGGDISPPPVKRRKLSAPLIQKQPIDPSPVPPPEDPNLMRVFSWNINGIAPFLQKPITSYFQQKSITDKDVIPAASLRGFLQRHNWPAILFLQEVKIASSDKKIQQAVQHVINAQNCSVGSRGPSYTAHFTLPTDPHNARGLGGSGKLYGVCSIVRSDISSLYKANVRTIDWDKEGRFSVVELTLPSTKTAIFNVYAVNGTDNPYRDPSTGANVWSLKKRGWHVLLAGDYNVAPDARDGYPKLRTFPKQHVTNRADFLKKFFGRGGDAEVEDVFEGVDIWREMHGDERRYTYFPRGRDWGSSCDRVDYVITGKRTWDRGMVKRCGILDSEVERGPSDHVPIWVDIDFEDTSEPLTLPRKPSVPRIE
ncbi:Endonuclease/exonuclease/phosphatase [Massariosphaeria phaeospora]|uniref:Endonuclease/exonuclease/phosphatase n=1 Tax=Massariosphaeria phaeospora TaxID=100035 RepID=A0A7C8MI05_9PLEO|nr:Endonuclease/exonuclease/phosphatase [Massariosphaeria phaeospora]